jgi:uncharacterized membrane protein YphA (DoxX/SURF4 family)
MNKFLMATPTLGHKNKILFIVRWWIGVMMVINGRYIFNPDGMVFFENLFRTSVPFPFPVFMAYLAKTIEFFGGILVCIGLFTRVASSLIGCTMLVATFTANKGALFEMYGALTFSLVCLSLWLLIFGPGRWSLDYYIFDRRLKKKEAKTLVPAQTR